MDTLSANTVNTYGFCLSSAAIKTRVHFFPSAGVSTGPFSISCMLTLFGKGIDKKSVMLDGGRLGQPDGVRLEDAFPALKSDTSGIFGLAVQLSCQPSRINLLSSQAVVELVSPHFSVMYGLSSFQPSLLPDAETSSDVIQESSSLAGSSGSAPTLQRKRVSSGVAIQDSSLVSSLVVVNSTSEIVKPDVHRNAAEPRVALQLGTVAAESTLEIPLEEALFRDSAPHESGWGLVRAEAVYAAPSTHGPHSQGLRVQANDSHQSGVGYFILYRDAVSKRPVSVCAL